MAGGRMAGMFLTPRLFPPISLRTHAGQIKRTERSGSVAKISKNVVGAPRKYESANALSKAVNQYFRSICYEDYVRDAQGRPVLNLDNEPIRHVFFAVAPTIPAMCLRLGITPRTWRNYCDENKHPEFAKVTSMTMAVLEAWLANESVTREKSLQGILFNLKNNYGWTDKQEIELGEKTRQTIKTHDALSLEEKIAYLSQMELPEIDEE